jgi:glycosyltransferase involved in cell wall biosynthesis
VALFSGNYHYVMDGPARALNRLVAHLEAKGHAALVFSPTTKKPAIKHSGTLIVVPSIPLPGPRSEYRLALGLPGSAREKLDEFRPDLVHVATPDRLGYAAVSYARARGIPAVASFHTRFDTFPHYYGLRWLEKPIAAYMRHFYRRCARIYAPSRSMVETLSVEGMGRDIRLWTRGVDADLFHPRRRDMAWRQAQGFSDEEVVVVFIGRLVLEKGIDSFVQSVDVASSRLQRIRTLIVGDGPERSGFAAKLPSGVFIGYQEGEALARAYASADVFFNPSVTETFGNVTLEAMASGLPSVCAAAAGSVSLIDDGATGFVVPPDEGATGYAARIELLARREDFRRTMGGAARARALEFSWPLVLDDLIRDYREVVEAFGARFDAEARPLRPAKEEAA